MIRILFIDGIQRGRLQLVEEAYPEYEIFQPAKISPHDTVMPWEHIPERITYKLMFRSMDGKTAIYSQADNSEKAITNARDFWMKPKLGKLIPIKMSKDGN